MSNRADFVLTPQSLWDAPWAGTTGGAGSQNGSCRNRVNEGQAAGESEQPE